MSLSGLGKLPKWAVVVNVLVMGLAAYFVVSLARDAGRPRTLPPPPAPRSAEQTRTPSSEARVAPVADDKLEQYNVIVAKHLFNPSRSEATTAAPPAAVVALPAKPVLHGVVLDETQSRAYLEDPSTKRVMSYRIGDTVAGGELKTIGADRVSINRRDGQINIMLKDPTKPQPVPVADASRPGANAQRQDPSEGAPRQPARAQRAVNPFAQLISPQSPGAALGSGPLPAPIPPEQLPAQR